MQTSIASVVMKLGEQERSAGALLDSVCGPYLGQGTVMRPYNSDDYNSGDDSRSSSEEETNGTDYYLRRRKFEFNSREDESTVDSRSYASEPDASTFHNSMCGGGRISSCRRSNDAPSIKTEGCATETRFTTAMNPSVTKSACIPTASAAILLSKQPPSPSLAKHCYFTKASIGRHAQHYEGVTLMCNSVHMLAAAMKLKECPTICDEDLRHVEQTYPIEFSHLPVELMLSSGWRRISKFCNFSNSPIPDGIPFFRKCTC